MRQILKIKMNARDFFYIRMEIALRYSGYLVGKSLPVALACSFAFEKKQITF